MDSQTYYTSLGLASTAPVLVIKAAYKSLALVHHPDKTIDLPADERAAHSATFREIQEAYDVLSNPSLRAAYDAELEHSTKGTFHSSTFHRADSLHRDPKQSKTSRTPPVKLTTPNEKAAMKAKVRLHMSQIQEEREKRDEEDQAMDINALKFSAKLWREMAEERKDFPTERAHCMIKIHEYEKKIQEREAEHAAWLNDLSTARSKSYSRYDDSMLHANSHSRLTPHSRSRTPSTPSIPIPSDRYQQRTEQRRRAEEERVAQAAARAVSRAEEKARQDALKQARLDAKAAAVRAEKEKHKRKTEELNQQEAARIARARAKAGAPPLEKSGAYTHDYEHDIDHVDVNDGASEYACSMAYSSVTALSSPDLSKWDRSCDSCGGVHNTVMSWKTCYLTRPHVADELFFTVG